MNATWLQFQQQVDSLPYMGASRIGTQINEFKRPQPHLRVFSRLTNPEILSGESSYTGITPWTESLLWQSFGKCVHPLEISPRVLKSIRAPPHNLFIMHIKKSPVICWVQLWVNLLVPPVQTTYTWVKHHKLLHTFSLSSCFATKIGSKWTDN